MRGVGFGRPGGRRVGDTSDRALATFAEAYANHNEHDSAAFQDAEVMRTRSAE